MASLASAQDAPSDATPVPPDGAVPPAPEPTSPTDPQTPTTNPAPTNPAPTNAPEEGQAIEDIDLEDLLNQPIVSSTKAEETAARTPAVVTVITSDEIRARGYTTLADVLRTVPGFYDVYDGVSHNVGVRGINGGARASGNVIKLMIDGQPVDFRPSTGNFFGEELIPLPAVERIEIIRGPASALYGANAFLGVVNVITRDGRRGSYAIAVGALRRTKLGGGGGLVLGAHEEGVDILLAAQGGFFDRSGLDLPRCASAGSPPQCSPALATDFDLASAGPSRRDFNRPRTLFGKLTLDRIAGGKLTLMASLQHLDADGELQDYGPLAGRTRDDLVNQNYRLSYNTTLSDTLELAANVSYLNAGPGDHQRLAIGRDDYVLLRNVGVDGFGAGVEAHYQPTKRINVTGGSDFGFERHTLQTFDQLLIRDVRATDGTVLRSRGTIIPGQEQGASKDFITAGLYLQGVAALDKSVSGTLGARVDVHNIYGVNLSTRGGVVWAPEKRALSVKLLYGSSFKAPSAVQLYTQPMATLDVRGNPELGAQRAQTVEAAATYGLPSGFGELAINVFGTQVKDRVEFVQQGLYLQAKNITDERILGGELESRLKPADRVRVRVSGGVARTVSSDSGLIGQPEVNNSLFPSYQAHVVADYTLPVCRGLRLSAETSYIGPRDTSQSNALVAGRSYQLDPYLYTGAAVSLDGCDALGRDSSAALRVTNVFDQSWPEPGFHGIDIPSQGFTAFFTYVQSL